MFTRAHREMWKLSYKTEQPLTWRVRLRDDGGGGETTSISFKHM